MATSYQNPYPSVIVFLFLLVNSCCCFNPSVSVLQSDSEWSPAGATWYGSPDGYGSSGGACGYGNTVERPPFASMVSAGGPSIYKSGEGCGACYQVKCTSNPACSGKPVTVVITDECPGCVTESAHFDLSGTAFGAMATPGNQDQLRNAGVLQIDYKRVECSYPGTNLAFHVDAGSNPYYFAVVIEYEQGDGDVASVELKQTLYSDLWLPMQKSWGAVWKLNSGSVLQTPMSLRLTTLESGSTTTANDVIPTGWQPGATYRAVAN